MVIIIPSKLVVLFVMAISYLSLCIQCIKKILIFSLSMFPVFPWWFCGHVAINRDSMQKFRLIRCGFEYMRKKMMNKDRIYWVIYLCWCVLFGFRWQQLAYFIALKWKANTRKEKKNRDANFTKLCYEIFNII